MEGYSFTGFKGLSGVDRQWRACFNICVPAAKAEPIKSALAQKGVVKAIFRHFQTFSPCDMFLLSSCLGKFEQDPSQKKRVQLQAPLKPEEESNLKPMLIAVSMH